MVQVSIMLTPGKEMTMNVQLQDEILQIVAKCSAPPSVSYVADELRFAGWRNLGDVRGLCEELGFSLVYEYAANGQDIRCTRVTL